MGRAGPRLLLPVADRGHIGPGQASGSQAQDRAPPAARPSLLGQRRGAGSGRQDRLPHRLCAAQSRAWCPRARTPNGARRGPSVGLHTSHTDSSKARPWGAAARVSPGPTCSALGAPVGPLQPGLAPLPSRLSAVSGVCSLSPCAFSRQVRGYQAAPSSRTFSAGFLQNPQHSARLHLPEAQGLCLACSTCWALAPSVRPPRPVPPPLPSSPGAGIHVPWGGQQRGLCDGRQGLCWGRL